MPRTEPHLPKNSITVLERRYLKKNQDGEITETPAEMFLRVASNIASAEKNYGATDAEVEQWTERFYETMASLEFLPNSPTLMNAGRDLQQLSACFVLPIEDSMEDIFETIKNTALIHKSGGGTGFSFSRVRPKNDMVRSTSGVSSGPISFMQVFDSATETIKQGGTRRGANMAILRVDHPDIKDFITAKEDNDRLNNFNISVAITEKFMEALEKDERYDLVNPHSGEVTNRYGAREIFDTIVNHAWGNGEPGIVFIDRINEDNPTPHVGMIESTNPCGEQPLLPYESCNLGSINLGKFVNEGGMDYDRLEKTVRLAVRFLDDVIDMNRFPLKLIEESTRANRKIGLGVMGFADMLLLAGIPYASDEAVKLGEDVMSFILKTGRDESHRLALERGAFPNFPGSVYDMGGGEKDLMRNATVTTIAPTGTLSIIAGASGGIEPLFAICFSRNVLDDDRLVEVNPIFEKVARDEGFYSEELMQRIATQGNLKDIEAVPEIIRKVFMTAHEISPDWHIKMQAAFQKYTDNAVSKTINFSNDAAVEEVREAYLLAYELGCKGITIYRDGSRDRQVLEMGGGESKKGEEKGDAVQQVLHRPRKRPIITTGSTVKMATGCGTLYVTINSDSKGLCEVFAQIGKSGGCAASQIEAISRMISLALRSGIDINSILKQLKGIRCPEQTIGIGGPILSCPDAMAKAIQKYLSIVAEKKPRMDTVLDDFVGESAEDGKTGDASAVPGMGKLETGGGSESGGNMVGICPDCGLPLIHEEGCVTCHGCGFSRC